MKSKIFLFLIFFQFFILIKAEESIKENENKELEESTKEEENNSEEKEKSKDEKSHMMTDEEFEEKLKQILKEKRIKKNMKISKDKLKEIFEIIYEKDFELPDLPEDKEGGEDKSETDPKLDSKRFLNEIFFNLGRSLDYDDEITPDQIKEYISPKRVQAVVGDIVENLIGMMGDL